MKTIVPVLVGVSLALTCAAGHAQETAKDVVKVSIERKSLRDALNEWAQQTGNQLIAEIKGEFVAPKIEGKLTAQEALDRLLEGTPLTYQWMGDRLVAIKEKPLVLPAALQPTSALNEKQTSIRVARLSGDEVERLRPAADDVRIAQNDQGSRNERRTREVESDTKALEEIVVTAQRRQERIEEVPISISVLNGKELDQSTVQGVTEALNTVPSVTAQESYIGGGTQISVRGVSGSSPILHGSSPIAYYLDSVPFGLIKTSIAPDANAFDLERVEVLRGPQGTLYGASALNGVVRVLTNDADLDEFEFKARTGVSGTKGGDVNYRADAAINIPIVTDKFAIRAVAGYQDLSGWIDRPHRDDVNSAEVKNLRFKANAQPTDALRIGLSTWFSRDDRGSPSQSRENDFHAIAADEPQSTSYDAYGLTIGYDFSPFTITSMTSHLRYENFGILNMEELAPVLAGIEFDNRYFAEVLSQELSLSSNSTGAWRWALGGIYRDEQDRTLQTFPGPFPLFPAPFDFDDTSESFAVYGEITRVVLDGHLELTAGLRYFEDKVDVHENVAANGIPDAPLIQGSSTFDKVTPRAVITWLPNDELTIYASYGEGFRSGFQQQPNVIRDSPQIPAVDADTLTNYEVGSKGRLSSGLISYEAAIYYIEWDDVQSDSSILINNLPVSALINGDSASGFGFDLSLSIRPTEGLSLGVAFSRNDLTYDSDVFSAGTVLFPEGSRLSMSPRTSAGGFLDYSFALGSGGYEAHFSASASYSSEQFIKIPSGVGQGDSILIARSSFTVDAPSNWEFSVYADNLTNEDGAIQRAPFLNTPDWTVRPRPRTIGLQVEYRY